MDARPYLAVLEMSWLSLGMKVLKFTKGKVSSRNGICRSVGRLVIRVGDRGFFQRNDPGSSLSYFE